MPVVPELLQRAKDTKKDKVARGLVMALALLVYGQEQNADVLIEQVRFVLPVPSRLNPDPWRPR